MSPVSAIALSGMKAALQRFDAAANNIANVRSHGPLPSAAATGCSPPYTPVDVVQTSVPGGGVVSRVVNSARGPVGYYDPSAPYADANGMVGAPDIDLASEMVNLITAELDFAANLVVLRAESQMMASLFDILA
ncbi:MAG TPA: flagellar basal body rod C-terminal domain-containing protein [Hyphomonadaceae bacterium]|nr:flagellar basal body rod C-terminal domain-containing protein [Hyphomonadaceae bacterium]